EGGRKGSGFYIPDPYRGVIVLRLHGEALAVRAPCQRPQANLATLRNGQFHQDPSPLYIPHAHDLLARADGYQPSVLAPLKGLDLWLGTAQERHVLRPGGVPDLNHPGLRPRTNGGEPPTVGTPTEDLAPRPPVAQHFGPGQGIPDPDHGGCPPERTRRQPFA